MNGIFLCRTGIPEMADSLDPSQPSTLPESWRVDLADCGPWISSDQIPDSQGCLFEESGTCTDTPAIVVTGPAGSAMSLAWHFVSQEILPEWGSVICISQRQGVGQLGRSWESPSGNLYAAVRLPDQILSGVHAGSLVAGYWIVHALRELSIPVQIKWPNDILLNNRKAGGILIQNRSGVMIAGIGLNLASAPEPYQLRSPEAIQAIALSKSGVQLTPLHLWRSLLDKAEPHVTSALAADRESFRDSIHELLAFRGEEILVDDHTGNPYRATLVGLSLTGELEVDVEHRTKTIRSGSIYPRRGF